MEKSVLLLPRLLVAAMLGSMPLAQAAAGESSEARSLPANSGANTITHSSPAGSAANAGVKPLAALPVMTLQSFEPDSLARIVEAERGHPFWLVIWDLDCPYCTKSMRHMAARQKTDAGLRVVTVTTDDMEQADAVRQRLLDIGIEGPAWAFGEASAQALRFAIDPAWRGEKPRAYYYDASGQRKAYSGVIDLDKFKP